MTNQIRCGKGDNNDLSCPHSHLVLRKWDQLLHNECVFRHTFAFRENQRRREAIPTWRWSILLHYTATSYRCFNATRAKKQADVVWQRDRTGNCLVSVLLIITLRVKYTCTCCVITCEEVRITSGEVHSGGKCVSVKFLLLRVFVDLMQGVVEDWGALWLLFLLPCFCSLCLHSWRRPYRTKCDSMCLSRQWSLRANVSLRNSCFLVPGLDLTRDLTHVSERKTQR
jgi:hypothetical protein